MPDTSALDTARTIVAAATVPFLAWFLGRGSASAKQKLDIRAADQTQITQLTARMEKLEGRVDTLMSEKFTLEQKVISLQTEIGKLEVLKLQYETRDATSNLQIKALEVRLAVKEEELRCAVEKLETWEKK